MHRIVNVVSDNFTPLPIYLHTISNYHPQENIRNKSGANNFHQILLILSGNGILKHKAETYQLKKGCAFFTASREPVEYMNTGGLVSSYVTVRGSAVDMMLGHFGYGGFLFYESVDLGKMMSDVNAIIDEFDSHHRESEISLLLYAFFMRFFEKDREEKLRPIDRTALYIEKNHMKKLTLEHLSEINGTSVSKLCTDFKKNFGATVFEYLINHRLKTAREILKIDESVSTKEAALSVGFEDISYFCRAYKKKYHLTPSEDRKKK